MAREEPDMEALNEVISSALVFNDEVGNDGSVQIICFCWGLCPKIQFIGMT